MNRGTDQILGHIGLVGKVDPRFDQRQRVDQALPPGFGAPASQALELPERLPALGRRLRRDEIGKPFDSREIEAAVLERAPSELTRLGQPATVDPAQRLEHGGNHRVAAVQLQFGDILAGLAVRRRKPQRQRLVDHVAVRPDRAPAPAPPCAARARARSACRARPGLRTGQAHHRNRRRRPAGGKREDGGAVGSHVGLITRVATQADFP